MTITIRPVDEQGPNEPFESVVKTFSGYEAQSAEAALESIRDALTRALEASYEANYGLAQQFVGIAIGCLPVIAEQGYVLYWPNVDEGWVSP